MALSIGEMTHSYTMCGESQKGLLTHLFCYKPLEFECTVSTSHVQGGYTSHEWSLVLG
jgi:hypothetical protein